MNLRVKALALSLATVAFLSSGVGAWADDDDDDYENDDFSISESSDSEHEPFPKPHRPHGEEHELHDRYGEDIGQVNLPPLVVKDSPVTGAAGLGGGEAVTTSSKNELANAGIDSPASNLPVDPATINPNQGTPADVFFSSATVGLGVMGAGALALGGFAVRRSILLSKDPKSDYLYQ